ncbi:MAG: hypothetical protein Q8L27_02400 [archaeon]|nr:hypothetical protein [archaeon]
MTEIKYRDWQGENRCYTLESTESLLHNNARCPLNNTPIIQVCVPNGAVIYCPNYNEQYRRIDKKGLKEQAKEKKERALKRLNELAFETSRLWGLIEKVDRPLKQKKECSIKP